MNKKIGLIIGSIAVAGVVGFGVYQSSADSDLLFQSTENGETEELEIRDSDTTEKAEDTAANVSQEENTASETEQTETETKRSAEKSAPELAREEVRAHLTAEYPGVITEFELDREDGMWIYEVDIYGSDAEYELDVDAETGEVIKVEQEIDNGRKYEVFSEADLISMEEAESIALNEFTGTIKEVGLEREDGRIIYEIEMKNKQEEADVDIDAITGEVIKLEVEYND